MAVCEFHRQCSTNTTVSALRGKYASRVIYVAEEAKFYVAWIENGAIKFGKYDPITHEASDEATIDTESGNNFIAALDMVRLADGKLVATWYNSIAGVSNNNAVAAESSDNGVTWTATVNQFAGTNEFPLGMCDNGTNVVVVVNGISSGGVGTGDLKAYKRTAVNTWAAVSSRFYDCDTLDNDPPRVPIMQNKNASRGLYMPNATDGVFVAWCSEVGDNNSKVLCSWTTNDGFATATKRTITTNTANSADCTIQSLITSAGRFWIMWPNNDNSQKPRFAYSDDLGVNWTIVECPTAVSTEMAALGISSLGPDDQGICLDIEENINYFHSTVAVLTTGFHVVYRSVDPTNDDWVVQGACSYTSASDVWSTTPAKEGAVDPTTGIHHRLTGMVRADGGSHYTLEWLSSQGIPPPPGVGESAPPVANAPAFFNNTLLRKDLGRGLGWSAHTIKVACFLPWNEGDVETGRERPILLYGNTDVDASHKDPSVIPVFSRLETDGDDGYGFDRVLDLDGDGNPIVTQDERRFLVRSRIFTLSSEFAMNVVRMAMVEYACDNPAGVLCQVWSDGQLVDTELLPPTGGRERKYLWDIPTDDNLGVTVQFIIDETSNYKLHVDRFGIVYLPKGRYVGPN